MIKCKECKKEYDEKNKKSHYAMNSITLIRCPYCGDFEDSSSMIN